MPPRCIEVLEAHGLSQPLLTLLHLMVCCTIATINFCLASDNSGQIVDITHIKQFLWAVVTIIKFPVEIDERFFFVQYKYKVPREIF